MNLAMLRSIATLIMKQVNLTGLINDCISLGVELANQPSKEALYQADAIIVHRLPQDAYANADDVAEHIDMFISQHSHRKPVKLSVKQVAECDGQYVVELSNGDYFAFSADDITHF